MKKNLLLATLALIIMAPMVMAEKIELSAKKADLAQNQPTQFTLGLVQSTVKEGMSQSEVIGFLGAPNIVTRDSDGKDSWVYDKIYTESSSLNHDGGAGIILVGWNRKSTRQSQVQKTITVILKFDKKQKLESYTYHNSQF